MPIINPFILTVNAGRKLATRPDILIAKGKSDSFGRNFESWNLPYACKYIGRA